MFGLILSKRLNLSDQILLNMLNFKPSSDDQDIAESSDEYEGVVAGDMEGLEDSDSDMSDDDDDDNDNTDKEDVPDIGEEAGTSAKTSENPFFEGSDDDSDDSFDDDSDDEEEDDKKKEAECDKEQEEEEDDLIKALREAREKKERNCPPDIKMSEMITDISFHPDDDLITVGSIVGDLSVFKYSNEENKMEKKLKISNKSLRGLEFTETGSSLLTISKDKTFRILDTETWTVRDKFVKCHDSALYTCLSLDEHVSVTGDEDGFIKMWDSRQGDTSIMTFKRFDEYVSALLKTNNHQLLASSGEGTIQSFDLRNKRPDIQSEVYESELNCMATVASGTKLAVGSGAGPIYLFK